MFFDQGILLKRLLGNLDGLTNQLENAAAEENALEEIFTMEDTSTHVNHFIELLQQINRPLGWENAKDLCRLMEKVSGFENKYKAKKRLLKFWFNVEDVVRKFFRKQTAGNWKNMEHFRISIEKFNGLRKSISDLANENLLQETCLDVCNIARCEPCNYILLLTCLRRIVWHRKRPLDFIFAFIVIVVLIAILVITQGWSNVKNSIEWGFRRLL